MSELSKIVDKLVDDYECEQEAKASSNEAAQVRAFAQGMFWAEALKMQKDGPLKIADVQLDRDEDGYYLPFFIITTESGIRLRVSVDVEPPS